MAFTNIPDLIADRDKYTKAAKTEISTQLKNNTIQKFYYYEGIPQGSAKVQMFVFGKVSAADLTTLKSKSSAQAVGECFVKDKELNIVLSKGRIAQDKLDKLMKEIAPAMSAVLSDGLAPNPALTGVAKSDDPAVKEASNIADLARKAVARLPKQLQGIGIDDLRDQLDEIEDLADEAKPDLPALRKALAALEKAVTKLDGSSGDVAPKPDTGAEAAQKLWDKVMERFDRVKALFTDSERADVRKLWALAETARDKATSVELTKVLVTIDKKIMETAKTAAADKAKVAAGGAPAPLAGSEAERLTGVIEKKIAWVKNAEALVSKERGALEKIRYEIMEMKEKGGDPTAKLKEFDVAEKRLNGARDALAEQRRQHGELLKMLDKASAVDPALKRLAEAAEKDLATLDSLIDDIPMQTAKDQIQKTLEEMGAAAEWREKRLKQEIAEGKHGMGRHGPQTGLEAQGVRAATSEAYLDTSGSTPKVKARGPGVTPDSASNPAGTAQRSVDRNPDGTPAGTTAKWNKVEITYVEEDGKRVIADVDKTAMAIVESGPLSGASTIGSMWATPVLEKRAYDIIDAIATKMQPYTHYKKKGPGYNEFKTIEITLGQKESGGAGWGYMVKKSGKASHSLSAATAKDLLHKFQDGKLTLDALFKLLSVRMADTDDTGKNMVMGVTAIYRRGATNEAFKLVTMYPDNSSDKLEWMPNKDYTGSLEFKSATDTKTFNMLAMP